MALIRPLGNPSGVIEYFVEGAGLEYHVKGDDGKYFTKDVSAIGEIPGSAWFGKAAKAAGLVGEVKAHDFELMLNRVLPSGERLSKNGGRQTEKGAQRSGYEMVFGMPKSFDIAALKYPEIYQWHEKALQGALEKIEKSLRTRETVNKVTSKVYTGAAAIAVFNHYTSRADECNTHSHAVITNVTKTGNGFKAIEGKDLFEFQYQILREYYKGLEKEALSAGFGLRYEHDKNGSPHPEIASVTREQIEGFSTRAKQIQDEISLRKGRGETVKDTQVIALMTRPGKSGIEAEQLMSGWMKTAENLGVDFAAMKTQPQQKSSQEPPQQKVAQEPLMVKASAVEQELEMAKSLGVDFAAMKTQPQQKSSQEPPQQKVAQEPLMVKASAVEQDKRERPAIKDDIALLRKEHHFRAVTNVSRVSWGGKEKIQLQGSFYEKPGTYQLGKTEKVAGFDVTQILKWNGSPRGFLVSKDGKDLGTVRKVITKNYESGLGLVGVSMFANFSRNEKTGEIRFREASWKQVGAEAELSDGFSALRIRNAVGQEKTLVMKDGQVQGVSNNLQRDLVHTQKVQASALGLKSTKILKTPDGMARLIPGINHGISIQKEQFVKFRLENGKVAEGVMRESKNLGEGLVARSVYDANNKFQGTLLFKDGRLDQFTRSRLVADPRQEIRDAWKAKANSYLGNHYITSRFGFSMYAKAGKTFFGKQKWRRVGLAERLTVHVTRAAIAITKRVFGIGMKAAGKAAQKAYEAHRMTALINAGYTREQAALGIASETRQGLSNIAGKAVGQMMSTAVATAAGKLVEAMHGQKIVPGAHPLLQVGTPQPGVGIEQKPEVAKGDAAPAIASPGVAENGKEVRLVHPASGQPEKGEAVPGAGAGDKGEKAPGLRLAEPAESFAGLRDQQLREQMERVPAQQVEPAAQGQGGRNDEPRQDKGKDSGAPAPQAADVPAVPVPHKEEKPAPARETDETGQSSGKGDGKKSMSPPAKGEVGPAERESSQEKVPAPVKVGEALKVASETKAKGIRKEAAKAKEAPKPRETEKTPQGKGKEPVQQDPASRGQGAGKQKGKEKKPQERGLER